MKNVLTKALALGLCGVGLVFLASCAAQKGTLTPNTSLIGANNAGSTKLPTVTNVITPGGLYNKLFVDFSADMDPASLNSTNVKVYQLVDAGGATYSDETEVTTVTLAYDATSRRLTVMGANGVWGNNTGYRINISNGVRSLTGRPLDGNANGIAESVEFDSYTTPFTLGTPTPVYKAYNMDPLQITDIDVRWNENASGTSILSGNLANARQYYTNVTISVMFSESVDEVSLTNNSNIVLTKVSDGSPVSLQGVSRTAVPTPGDWPRRVEFAYTLDPNTKYKVTIKGGLAGFRTITDKTDPNASGGLRAPGYGRYFNNHMATSGNTSKAEASDDFTREFTTGTATGLPFIPITVGSCNTTTAVADRKFTVTFSITPLVSDATNSKVRLDETTITPANFQLFVSSGGTYQIPVKQLVFNGTTAVDVYLPDTFYPNSGSVSVYLKVLPGVKSVEGLTLDANGNGIGGETADVYQSFSAPFMSKIVPPVI